MGHARLRAGVHAVKKLRGLLAGILLLLPVLAGAQTLTFTTPGNTSFVVPPGVTQINFAVYGPSAGNVNATSGGQAGGGFCQSQLPVTAGNTVFLQVGEPTPGGDSTSPSWVNVSVSLAPTSRSQGCATIGSDSGTPGSGQFGTVNNTGGNGGSVTDASNQGGGGGGGGAGPGGNGQAGTDSFGSVPGVGGSGGPGAALGTPPFFFPAGGNGGNGGAPGVTGMAGTAPGGGFGGGGFDPSAGNGAPQNGQVIVVFVFTPPVSSSASSMFLSWPG
jgi:hypothetical protein